jgi:hypothetical protein
MPDFITLPPNLTSFRLANARVPVCLVADPSQLKTDADGLAPCDIVIDSGRIATIGPTVPDGLPGFDLRDGIVLPRLVDMHTHIDKGHIWRRAPNPDGSFLGARMTVMADREANWTAEDVARRMDFSLRCAFAHGTGALRTHIDSIGKQTAISWGVFAEMREQWKGRITLQAASIYPTEFAIDDEPQFRAMVETVARHGGVLGGLTYMGEPLTPKTDAALDKVFEAAQAHGLDLDFHVDESDSPQARSLERIADAALRHKFSGADRCRPLLLARAGRRRGARAHHRQGGGSRHRGGLAADVQHVSAGPASWTHAALARRRAAARAGRGRRHRDGRERQHARSVLRLWRPRPDRGSFARRRASCTSTIRRSRGSRPSRRRRAR